jgi:hypothetical protein
MSPFVVFPLLFLALVIVTIALQIESQRELEGKRRWRIKSVGADCYYQELREGEWRGIELAKEPRGHGYTFRLPSDADWNQAEPWLSSRRDEIIARIRSEMPDVDARHPLRFT